ncbi:MAG: hypothetical protein WAQ24_01705 [Candidatus Saccharimonadales bacterium]
MPALARVTTCEPPVEALLPLHPFPPAVHEVALFATDHTIVVVLPAAIVFGVAETETLGTATTVKRADCVELVPTEFEQDNE